MAHSPICSSPIKLFIYYYLPLVVAMIYNIPSSKAQRLNQTSFVFFLQDFGPNSPNATVVPITGITGKTWSLSTFGTVFAIDDLITETPDKRSNKLGRAQGLLVVSALDALNMNVLMSIVFTNVQYGGSTLELQGISHQDERATELSVVSGTGKFRFARGYAIFDTIYFERATSYSIIRCTIRLGNS